jgi:hypothetical protein
MERSYKRRILVRTNADGLSVDLEDNFHRFGVRLWVEGDTVVRVEGAALRVPWETCPGAVAALQDLEGHDVRAKFHIDGHSKAARHCTHLFDIAMLGLDHLRLDIPRRDYLISAEGPGEHECVTLDVDGRRIHTWELADNIFVSPAAWRGNDARTVHKLVAEEMDAVALVELMLLRRAVQISHGRFIDQDEWKTAADLGATPSCISFQPGNRDEAVRIKRSARDFTDAENLLLGDL